MTYHHYASRIFLLNNENSTHPLAPPSISIPVIGSTGRKSLDSICYNSKQKEEKIHCLLPCKIQIILLVVKILTNM